MTLLSRARFILKQHSGGLFGKELFTRMRIYVKGKTPEKTIPAMIYLDIKNNQNSKFYRRMDQKTGNYLYFTK